MNNSFMPYPQEREAPLFALALKKPFPERVAFLPAGRGSSGALRQRPEALLVAHDQTEDVLAITTPADARTIRPDLQPEPPDEAAYLPRGNRRITDSRTRIVIDMALPVLESKPHRRGEGKREDRTALNL